MRAVDVPNKFAPFVDRSYTNCWEWDMYVAPNGYGKIRIGNRMIYAHRAAFELFVRPLEAGEYIDHLCRNRKCVNPKHMEAVPHRINTLRGIGPAAVNHRKTHCINGHEFTEENTYRLNGKRHCRTCHREYERERRAREKAAR
jgi:hypothetical protein